MKTFFSFLVLSIGLVLGGFFPGYFYYKTIQHNRTVSVKGLAEMNVEANLAIWKIKFKTTGNDLKILNNKMGKDADEINNFLISKGFSPDEIILGRLNSNDLMTNAYRDDHAENSRYILDQTITVRTSKVRETETSLNEIGSLVAKGVIFDFQDYVAPVSYLFTGLNDIKPKMLEEATKNAKQAADEFAKSSNSKVGKIKSANQGVFSILPRDQTPNINESEQIEKTVRVVSTIVYYID
ncbi:MAG: SIMPL domain-containing protein [Alphaproteobacteria bacterium]|nr:SIMPL domain-containing protein [Alphaproteobacteria bacterium]